MAIVETLREVDMLRDSQKGLGAAVGEGRQPSAYTDRGGSVLATEGHAF